MYTVSVNGKMKREMKRASRKDTSISVPDLTKPVLNLEEAAAFLQLSTRALRDKAKAGEIPGVKMGHWRFSREELQRMFSTSN